MVSKARWSVCSIAIALLGMGPANAAPAPDSAPLPDPARIAVIEKMLPESPAGIGPRITDRAAWEHLAQLPAYQKLLKAADKINAEEVPDQPDALFLLFTQKGDRASWEKVAFKRRGNFTTLVLAECLRNDGAYMSSISDYIRALCAEPTWLLSAHDGKLLNFTGKTIDVDLGSSTLGWQMATADWFLDDKLPSDVRTLVRTNLKRRIIDPMIARYTGAEKPYWWMVGNNNWTTVCLAGVTGVGLEAVPDRHTRALFTGAAELYCNYYFKGINPDGYCSEGLGYWNYGFGRFVMLAETVNQATGGKLDLLARPDAIQLAHFASRLQIINSVAPAFADSAVYPKPDANLMHFLNRRFQLGLAAYEEAPAPEPLGDLDAEAVYHFPNAATNMKSAGTKAQFELRSWFDRTGVLIARPAPDSGCHIGVALKGGNNAENHNHNDIGSYVFVLNDKCLILDPGHETYTARTFSAHRYDSNLLNSFGHDVPMVAEKLQRTGAIAQAKIVKTAFTDDADALTLDITSAYDVPDLVKLERTWVYSRKGAGSLTITDHAQFKSPQSFGTALITLGKWSQPDPAHLVIEDGKQSATIAITASGTTTVDPVVIKENAPVTPTRLGINLAEKTTDATITLVVTPTETRN